MLDFIVENIWVIVIIGAVIILTAIGYIVDKFIINKDKNEKKEKENNENSEVSQEEQGEIPNANQEQVEVSQEEQSEIPDANQEQVEVSQEEQGEVPDANQETTGDDVVVTEPMFPNDDEDKNEQKQEV